MGGTRDTTDARPDAGHRYLRVSGRKAWLPSRPPVVAHIYGTRPTRGKDGNAGYDRHRAVGRVNAHGIRPTQARDTTNQTAGYDRCRYGIRPTPTGFNETAGLIKTITYIQATNPVIFLLIHYLISSLIRHHLRAHWPRTGFSKEKPPARVLHADATPQRNRPAADAPAQPRDQSAPVNTASAVWISGTVLIFAESKAGF